MGCRSTVFGREPWINTIIGGVASSIPSKSSLATKLGISESIITRFEIVGSDVRSTIKGGYSIPNNAFLSDTTINSYIDLDGIISLVGASAFQNSTIQNAKFENADLGNSALNGCTLLTNDLFSGEFKSNRSSFVGSNQLRATKINKFTGLNLTTLPGAFLQNNTDLVSLDAPNATIGNSACLDGCTMLNNIPTSFVDLSTFAMRNCSSVPILVQNSLTSVAANTFNGMSSVVEAYFLSLESITSKGATFAGWTSSVLIDMRKLKVLAPANSASTTFANLKLNCEIRVHINLATDNSGSPNATLAWVKANRSAVVKFYDDNGNYVSTL